MKLGKDAAAINRYRIRWAVYFVGVILLGLIYYPLKGFINNDPLFVVAAVVYLFLLRAAGSFVARRWQAK